MSFESFFVNLSLVLDAKLCFVFLFYLNVFRVFITFSLFYKHRDGLGPSAGWCVGGTPLNVFPCYSTADRDGRW
jgi:hypothetical protein